MEKSAKKGQQVKKESLISKIKKIFDVSGDENIFCIIVNDNCVIAKILPSVFENNEKKIRIYEDKTIKIQRDINIERVEEIVEYKKSNKEEGKFSFFDALVTVISNDSSHLNLIDGQHRFSAYLRLLKECGSETLPPLILTVYRFNNINQIKNKFVELNKAEPVKINQCNFNKQKKSMIISAIDSYCSQYDKWHFSENDNTQIGKISKKFFLELITEYLPKLEERLRNEGLSDDDFYSTEEPLVRLLTKINDHLTKKKRPFYIREKEDEGKKKFGGYVLPEARYERMRKDKFFWGVFAFKTQKYRIIMVEFEDFFGEFVERLTKAEMIEMIGKDLLG